MVEFVAHLKPQYITPDSPVGFTKDLWKYDVVEFFFCHPDGSYIEIEVGPAGHWLVYEFSSYRHPLDTMPRVLRYESRVLGLRWEGKFFMPLAWLKSSLEQCRVNAYQIRTATSGREYFAWRSIPTLAPDFHNAGCFDFLPIT